MSESARIRAVVSRTPDFARRLRDHAIGHGFDSLSDERSDVARFGVDAHVYEYSTECSVESRAALVWSSAAPRSGLGEAYIESRGLDASVLIERDAVRFDINGNPVVALRNFVDGRIMNVVTRRRRVGELPKAPGLTGCHNIGSLVGRIDQVTGDVVVVEGVVDSLTAIETFPGVAVCGAHSAGAMAALIEAAAIRVSVTGGVLWVVPHADGHDGIPGAGERAAITGGRAAMALGLELGRTLRIVDLGASEDLNDAWRAGWRWSP